MKLIKKILLVALSLCLSFGIIAIVAACKTKNPSGKEEPVTYAVTYAFGSCDGVDYAGADALPAEEKKEKDATFALAEAPLWAGYQFLGWNDGVTAYDAGAQYTMPAHAVTLTAQWEAKFTKHTNVTVETWGSELSASYALEKGQYIEYKGEISAKGDYVGYGIVGQIYLNGDTSRWYFFRPDCPATYTVGADDPWGWWNTEVFETNFSLDETKYNAATAGTVHIIAELSEEGKLTYTVAFSSESYSYTNVYTSKETINEARVYFAADNATAGKATVTIAESVRLSFDWNTAEEHVDTYTVSGGDYTFGENPVREGYSFLGWQVDGKGEYYGQGQTYRLSYENVSFVAAWGESIAIAIDKDGGKGSIETSVPVYNAVTEKFDVALPSSAKLTKDDCKFVRWEVKIGGTEISVSGETFALAPGETVVLKAIWVTVYTVTYAGGSCNSFNYGKELPSETPKESGETFAVGDALVWGGFEFLGWSDGEKTYQAGDTYTVGTQNVTLTAQWQINGTAYTVTFNAGKYGTTPYAGTTNIDTREDTPAGMEFPLARTLYWEGYTFDGWYEDGTGKVYDAIERYTMPAHNVSFTAQWTKELTYTISYAANAEGDTVLNMPEDTSYFNGQAFRQIPIRFGYTFLGWNDGTNTYKIGEKLPVENLSDDITLTAQWESLRDSMPSWVILTGIWKYEPANGGSAKYLIISGRECELDFYMAIGYTQAGRMYDFTTSNGNFSFRADRGYNYGGKGTDSGTYDAETDTIKRSSETYVRMTPKCTYSGGEFVVEDDSAATSAPSAEEYALPADDKRS